MIRRSSLSACLLVILSIALPGAAVASDVCERLNARLTDLPQSMGASSNTRIYSNAISRQSIQMRKTKADIRRLGCSSGSVIVYGNANADTCDMLADTVDRMQNNLDTLDSKRRDAAMGRNEAVIRQHILAALDANGCNAETEEVLEASIDEPKIHRNILKDIAPVGEGVPMLRDGLGVTELTLDGAPTHGSLRTLCVRTCDGAFFPISSNASPMDFSRDAQVCSARCPATETELYYHSLSTEETDQMISAVSGQPYSLLPTAFSYKTRDLDQPNACTCNLGALNRTAPVKNQSDAQQMAVPAITEMRTTTDLAEKAETTAVAEERTYDPTAKVRIVGPTFLPQEETSIDLKNPANPAVQ